MIKALLAMTAAYAVLGGAVALGFLSIAVWICLILIVAAGLAYLSVYSAAVSTLRRLTAVARKNRRLFAAAPRRFNDDKDYLDWARRRGRWAAPELTSAGGEGRAPLS